MSDKGTSETCSGSKRRRSLRLAGAEGLICYAVYHPYGTSAYQATDASLEAAAHRYRYARMQRDEESGLCYFGARYLAPWLGRFLSVDPKAGEYSYVALLHFAHRFHCPLWQYWPVLCRVQMAKS